jgi:hypothetical protein
MHLRGYVLLGLIVALLCSADCGVPYMIYSAVTPPHVTEKNFGHTDYRQNGLYRLRQAVFVVSQPSKIAGGFPENAIFPAGYTPSDNTRPVSIKGVTMPSSIDEYHRTPGNWPEIVAILAAGQTIQFKEICLVGTPSFANPLFPGGDWPSAFPLFLVRADGIGLVNGLSISATNPHFNTLEVDVDEDYLEPVAPPTTSP